MPTYEITLKDINGLDHDDEYGFGSNPPVVVRALYGREAIAKLELPKNVKVRSIKKVK